MINIEKCDYGPENLLKRKELKKRGYISSVELSRNYSAYGVPMIESNQFRKMKRFCRKSEKYHCIALTISGTVKNWYRKDQVREIIKAIT